MPKGPQGQKRPADAIGCAVNVARIATGEDVDIISTTSRHRSGVAGAKARAKKLDAKERQKIAKNAAMTRWNTKGENDMSKSGVDQLHTLLFEEGRELINIKFLPGINRGLTESDMSSEAARVIRSAQAKGPQNRPPLSGLQKSEV